MLAQVHNPQDVLSEQLDDYLHRGWFRMGQTIFTTNFLHVKKEIFSTIWLRIVLSDYVIDHSGSSLFKRNARFETSIWPATITAEKELLYDAYKALVPFQASRSLLDLLFGDRADAPSVYNTYEVTVRDAGVLVACGFFDLGKTSAEGIVSFYDPRYKKHSLGRYLIYRKIEFCVRHGLTYFYPGYFVPGNKHFDYKLRIGKNALEFLELKTNSWNPIKDFVADTIPVDVMMNKLSEVQSMLHDHEIVSHVFKYEYFDVNLMPQLRDKGLFEVPVILTIGEQREVETEILITFDIRDDAYHLMLCAPILKPTEINSDPRFYSEYVLGAPHEIHVTPDAEAMVAIITNFLKI